MRSVSFVGIATGQFDGPFVGLSPAVAEKNPLPEAGSADFFRSYVLPAIAVIVFWIYKSATPGKMAISAKIVDAETGENPSTAQCIGRYFAYFVSIFPLCLGIFWVAFDKKKQGWHDKLAGTVVVRKKNGGVESVTFTRP